jgi:hypothetical protein
VEQPGDWLGRTFAQLAAMLTSDLDVGEYLATVADRGTELVAGAYIGILLADEGGMLTAVAASPDRVRIIELLELQNWEGPALACYLHGERRVNVVLDERTCSACPTFGSRALKEGFRVVHALPMRLPEALIGVLTILDTRERTLRRPLLELAQSLANLATVGVVQQRHGRQPTYVADQLRASVDQRVVIEQAKGFVTQRLGVDIDTAFQLMRTHARTNSVRLGDLAHGIVAAHVAPEELWQGPGQAGLTSRHDATIVKTGAA